ncbi:MAG: TRAP transporter permease [Anaerofustis stercorihominis]|nr:TRAP transporter permease [Anaerofustis stercorihominis]
MSNLTTENTHEEINIEELMSEFDRDSNTRHFTGMYKHCITGLLVGFALLIFAMTLFITPPEQVRRSIFLGCIIFIVFLLYPVTKKSNKRVNYIPIYDIILAVVGAAAYFYFAINFEAIVNRAIMINNTDKIVAIIGIVILVEACRRVSGIPILIVAGLFVGYAFTQGYSLHRVIHQLYYTTNGIIGTPLGVCATFIALFISLGSFLEQTNIGMFFIDLANSIAGSATGGPAKVAVITSAFEGMYSGSSVANTVGSGSITIPIMKDIGYKPEFAAAVEAAASTGGQIMPPIMGAAAFLMAEITNTPYSTIVTIAILPAILYFTGIFLMIHFEAKKLGLKGLPKDTLPNFFKLIITKGYLLLPIVVLVVLMNIGYTPAYAACFAILTSIIVSMFNKDTRLTPSKLIDALAGGTKNTLSVAVACAISGVVVGIVTLTGLGQTLVGILMGVAENSIFLALFFTMIACIVIGMGIPTTATYVIMATVTAPILVKMGIPTLAAHMFVFYFGIVADITPPVALAAYAGAAIAKSNPLKTGATATRLAITAFIIPYIFAMNPAMLFIDTTFLEVVQIVITSIIGTTGVAVAMEGYGLAPAGWLERIIIGVGGLMLVWPGNLTDVIGCVCVGVVFAYQYIKLKKTKETA